MRITSIDSKAWVEITHGKDYLSFNMECAVNSRQNFFQGKNTDFHFLNTEEFIEDLDKFILNRDVLPQLKGVHGPCLVFYRSKKQATAVMVRFSVSDDSSAYSEGVEFKTTGTLEINSEFLNEYVKEFKRLFKA
jgi:hypothetical protein